VNVEPENMKSAINRLKRAQGQLNAVVRMLEEGQDCKAIITQLSAVSSAVDKAGFSIIATNLQACMAKPDSDLEVAELEKMFISLA
jgi:DNA-binding FrmR family transcriptional regulator